MTQFPVRSALSGACDAPAVVTGQPINFPAAFCKAANILPFKRGEIRDEHHDLFGTHIGGKALVFPTCVGSTYTGLVLLELIKTGRGPAALIVAMADPLLVSGCVLAQVWYQRVIPVVELCDPGTLDRIATGNRVRIERGGTEMEIVPARVPGPFAGQPG